jgi:carbonic anhydrase/acetyltransferase-like protein (isoleucine patch superfamily)
MPLFMVVPLQDNVLIGMGAIVMDNCVVESNSIVAAGAVVTSKYNC